MRCRFAPVISLTYISASCIAADAADVQIDLLVAHARASNARYEISGGLLYTGTHFAATLEGDRERVATLLTAIEEDTRHRELCVIDTRRIAYRRFTLWSLAYAGASSYVADAVTRGLAGHHRGEPGDVARLLRLIVAFSRAGPHSAP